MDSVKHLFSFFFKIAFGIFVVVLVIWLTKAVSNGSKQNTTATSTKAVETQPKKDLLPSPRKYSGFFSSDKNNSLTTAKPFVYTGAIAGEGVPINNFNNSYSYNTYSSGKRQPIFDPSGSYIIGYATSTSDTTGYTNKSSKGQPIFDSTGSYIIGYSDATIRNSPQTVTQTESNSIRAQTIRNLSIYQGGHVYTGLSFFGEAHSSMFRDGKFPIVVIDAAGRLVGVSSAIATTQWSVPGWVRFETKVTYPLPSNVPCTMIFEEALMQTEKTRAPVRVPIPIRCN